MHPTTALRSRAIRIMASQRLLKLRRAKARAARKLGRQPPAVHYFHQVDDPYSHMAVQKLRAFAGKCSIDVIPHLVTPPEPAYLGDDGRFDEWAQRDARSVAAGFGVRLGTGSVLRRPARDQVVAAQNLLATALPVRSEPPATSATAEKADLTRFADLAIRLGDALWNGTPVSEAVAAAEPEPTPTRTSNLLNTTTVAALADGDQLRAALGHYQGAMFWFDGEWYWGLDRLHLLEARLQEEGFIETGGAYSCPIPADFDTALTARNCSSVTLEYFPSLRSPYTAIGHPRVLRLIEHTGVTVQLRPVMPMLMRGVPAPRSKQTWIISDAAREARFHNVTFGKIVDPFGDPVKRAFALFPAATRLGKGMEFTTAYLQAAWTDGVDISSDHGLRSVAQSAGLDYERLRSEAAGDDWEAVLTENVNIMLAAGLWGVPSFRVTGGSGPRSADAFACWGQDRLWRVAEEISARA